MMKIAALGILSLLLITGTATASTSALPWSTVSELERHVTQAFSATGCGDARPLVLFVVVEGSEEYYLLVNADARWAILGPVDAEGQALIWYGSFTSEDRIVIERSLVGTTQTNLCPFLARQSA